MLRRNPPIPQIQVCPSADPCWLSKVRTQQHQSQCFSSWKFYFGTTTVHNEPPFILIAITCSSYWFDPVTQTVDRCVSFSHLHLKSQDPAASRTLLGCQSRLRTVERMGFLMCLLTHLKQNQTKIRHKIYMNIFYLIPTNPQSTPQKDLSLSMTKHISFGKNFMSKFFTVSWAICELYG